MNKLNILVVVPSLYGGGAERVAVNVAGYWANSGHNVSLLTYSSPDRDVYSVDAKVKRIALVLDGDSATFLGKIWRYQKRLFAIRKAIKDNQSNVVVAFMAMPSITSILAGKFLPAQVIATERCYPPLQPYSKLMRWACKKLYPHAKCLVVQTSGVQSWAQQTIPNCNIAVIPNSVQYPLINNHSASNCVAPPVNKKIILGVGRLVKDKGFDCLIAAFARSVTAQKDNATNHEGWHLCIIGAGSDQEVLSQQIKNLGMQEHISLVGHVGNMNQWYEQADIYVLSSRTEGFPNSLLEAMSYGCACVAYNCLTGPADMIIHQENGLLVDQVADVPALADGLQLLMTNDALRHKLGQNAISVRTTFAPTTIFAQWNKVLQQD